MNRNDAIWIYGYYTCKTALLNPKRKCRNVILLQSKKKQYEDIIQYCDTQSIAIDFVDNATLQNIIPNNNHQGIAIRVSLLPQISVTDIECSIEGKSIILVLDHITDPQNFGSILRSAVAFDVDAVIVPKDNSVKESPAVAKTASGALDLIQIINVANINNAIKYLKSQDYWCYGLVQDAETNIMSADITDKVIIVMGSENAGIKQLTRKQCDFLISIPMNFAKMPSLNVANATGIALFSIYQKLNAI